jgi:hypothetical protein
MRVSRWNCIIQAMWEGGMEAYPLPPGAIRHQHDQIDFSRYKGIAWREGVDPRSPPCPPPMRMLYVTYIKTAWSGHKTTPCRSAPHFLRLISIQLKPLCHPSHFPYMRPISPAYAELKVYCLVCPIFPVHQKQNNSAEGLFIKYSADCRYKQFF